METKVDNVFDLQKALIKISRILITISILTLISLVAAELYWPSLSDAITPALREFSESQEQQLGYLIGERYLNIVAISIIPIALISYILLWFQKIAGVLLTVAMYLYFSGFDILFEQVGVTEPAVSAGSDLITFVDGAICALVWTNRTLAKTQVT